MSLIITPQILISIFIMQIFDQFTSKDLSESKICLETEFQRVERDLCYVEKRRLRTRGCLSHLECKTRSISIHVDYLQSIVSRNIDYMRCRAQRKQPATNIGEAFTFMLTIKRYFKVRELKMKVNCFRRRVQRVLRHMSRANMWYASPDGTQNAGCQDFYTIDQLARGASYQNSLRAQVQNLSPEPMSTETLNLATSVLRTQFPSRIPRPRRYFRFYNELDQYDPPQSVVAIRPRSGS